MTRSGSGEAKVRSLRLVDAETGHDVAMAKVGQRLRLELDASAEHAIAHLVWAS